MIKLFKKLTGNNILRFNVHCQIRNLFTHDTLGITTYKADREIEHLQTSQPDNFKIIFGQKLKNGLPQGVLVDELRKFLHLIDDSPNDVNLLRKALKQYKEKTINWKKQNFHDELKSYEFGTIAMRAFNLFEQPDVAVEFFEDKAIGSLFDQYVTYVLLFNLLYQHKKYDKLLQMHKEYSDNRMKPKTREPTFATINCIVFATCFQLNTSQHHDYAFKLYNKILESGTLKKQLRKGIALVAEMERREKRPQKCFEILSLYDAHDPNIRYIKILAHLDLNQFEEAYKLLRISIEIKNVAQVFPVPDELIEYINVKVKNTDNMDLLDKFQKLFEQLQKMDRTTSRSLNEALSYPFPKKFVLMGKPYRHTKMHEIYSTNN